MIRLNASGIFKLFMMGVGLVGLILATSYNPTARMIPLGLSVLLIVLMALMFLQENVPALSKYFGFMGQRGLFSEEKAKTDSAEKSEEAKQEYRKLFRLIIWLVAFTILLGYVNYLIAVPLFLLLFIRLEGGQSWRSAVYVAAGMGIFNFLLFDLLLKTSL